MTRIRGNAALVLGATTHELAAPLRILAYRELGTGVVRQPLDRSRTDRTFLDASAYEIRAIVQYDDNPIRLVDVLRAASDEGETIAYLPDDSDTEYSFGLYPMIVGDAVEVVQDRDFGGWSYRWEIEVTFRGVGSDLLGLIVGQLAVVADPLGGWAIDSASADAHLLTDLLGGLTADESADDGATIRRTIGYQAS